jgi:nitroreductase
VTFDLSETDRLLTTTRSVRKRLDLTRPVNRAVFLDCLRLATQAPNGSNRQLWRWLVIDEAELRRSLGELYRRSFQPYVGDSVAVQAATGTGVTAAIHTSSIHLAEHLAEVPVHVIPCISDRLPDRPTTREAAALCGSILPAVWSFMLALRSRGLGSAYTTLLTRSEDGGGGTPRDPGRRHPGGAAAGRIHP